MINLYLFFSARSVCCGGVQMGQRLDYSLTKIDEAVNSGAESAVHLDR